MSLAATRAELRSVAPIVLVEAAAGCGKTHEAAQLALDLASAMPENRSVLLLAHTNAAVQEFARRVWQRGADVRVTTIDAFCLDLIEPYAGALGLPEPLRRHIGLGAGRIGFGRLAPKAAELLNRAPTIARALALRYPLIILDEHQDARPAQHKVVQLLAEIGGARLRIFGDPMQAIFERAEERLVNWDLLEGEASVCCKLGSHQRWRHNQGLGDWIMEARAALRSAAALPLTNLPSSVRLVVVPELIDAGPTVGGRPRRVDPAAVRPLHRYLDGVDGRAVILVGTNDIAFSTSVATRGRLIINEGVQFDAAYSALEAALQSVGQPRRLAQVLLDLLQKSSTGLDASKRTACERAFQASCIELGRNQQLRGFMLAFGPIYDQPDLRGFQRVLSRIIHAPPDWLALRLPQTLRILAQFHLEPDDDPHEALDALVSARKMAVHRPNQSVSTIHKAKGLEYEHVLITPFGLRQFGNNEYCRRLAYVGLSRAIASIALLVPGRAPSPLLGRIEITGR